MMPAIILDGQLKSALAAVRSLGAHRIPFAVGAPRETAMALHSRYAAETFVYPSPYVNQEGFIESVRHAALRLGGKPLVYAFSDATYLSLYAAREVLQDCVTLVFPRGMSVEIAFDKGATYSRARVSGVPTVTTYMPETREDIERTANALSYPAVVKTRRSVTWKEGVGIFGSATFVHSKEELVQVFEKLRAALGEAPLIQPFMFGEEYGVEMLVRRGKPYACVTHHRIRSLSPTGGASVLKETLEDSELRRALEAHAFTMARVLEWEGPIMVEFKVDPDTKVPHLMEVNGRFWGSLPLSVAAGVDMPYLYHSGVSGAEITLMESRGREGVTTRHFLGDAVHLLRVLFKRDRMRPILYPERTLALRQFFTLPAGTKSDVWWLRDPKPAIMEFVDMFSKLWK